MSDPSATLTLAVLQGRQASRIVVHSLSGRPLQSQDCQKFATQLVRVLQASNCPVTNSQPSIIPWNAGPPFQNYPGVKTGLQEAARAAYMQSKANPQLIIVLMPVSGFLILQPERC